jgi:ABC-type bacteriocin/lantibiotic exporter with double-glycine peptidase domain
VIFLDEAFDQMDIALEHRISSALSERSLSLVIVTHRTESVATSTRRFELRTAGLDRTAQEERSSSARS